MTLDEIFPTYKATVLQDGHVDRITGKPRCIVVPQEGPRTGLYLLAFTDEVLKEGASVVYHTFGKRAALEQSK